MWQTDILSNHPFEFLKGDWTKHACCFVVACFPNVSCRLFLRRTCEINPMVKHSTWCDTSHFYLPTELKKRRVKQFKELKKRKTRTCGLKHWLWPSSYVVNPFSSCMQKHEALLSIHPEMSWDANSTQRRASLPRKPISGLYYSGRPRTENVPMLRDSHNVCVTALPKNGTFLFLRMTAQAQTPLEGLLHY